VISSAVCRLRSAPLDKIVESPHETTDVDILSTPKSGYSASASMSA
jgi:hypothetical protein